MFGISNIIEVAVLPVSKSDLLNEKEIEQVVILNGEKSITLNSVEIDGKMYRPAIIYSGSDLCITYYIAHSGLNGEIRKQTVRVAPEKVAIFYIKEDVEEN